MMKKIFIWQDELRGYARNRNPTIFLELYNMATFQSTVKVLSIFIAGFLQ